MFIAQSSSGDSGLGSLLIIVIIFGALFMFMSYRQRKRGRERAEFLDSLQVGDEVRTIGGVIATIESIDDEALVVVSWGTRLRLVRGSIAARVDDQ